MNKSMWSVCLAGVLLSLAPLASGQNEKKPDPKAANETQPAAPSQPAAPDKKPDDKKEELVYVSMKTSMGDIVIELDRAKAPISVANFLSYVDKKQYDGTIFHRVIKDFMIQGGGFTADMKEKSTDKPIKNEWQNGLKNKRGTIAMARKGAGPDSPNSATCQFFINTVDNGFLDQPQRDGAAYAVFGKVVKGMETVDKIRAVKTTMKGGMPDVPEETVTIVGVTKMTDDEVAKLKAADKK